MRLDEKLNQIIKGSCFFMCADKGVLASRVKIENKAFVDVTTKNYVSFEIKEKYDNVVISAAMVLEDLLKAIEKAEKISDNIYLYGTKPTDEKQTKRVKYSNMIWLGASVDVLELYNSTEVEGVDYGLHLISNNASKVVDSDVVTEKPKRKRRTKKEMND